MTAEIVNWDDAAAKFERDRRAFRLRLNGVPVRAIATQLECTPADVESSLIRMCGGVTPSLRARTVEIELERLDDLTQIYFGKAREGDYEATGLVLRLMERRSRMLGLDIMPRAFASDENRPPPASTTDKIMEALNRLKHGPIIEGEAVEEGKVVEEGNGA
jgi:hypothetical protein